MVDWIEELIAQVEAHGDDAVVFYFVSHTEEEPKPVFIQDVKYEDGEIRVTITE